MASTKSNPNRKKLLLAGAFGLAAVAVIMFEVLSGAFSRHTNSGGPTQAYFSADDGASYFADSSDLKTPYEKDGKTVVRAHVFQQGGKPAVVYLSRFTADHLRVLAAPPTPLSQGKRPKIADSDIQFMGIGGTEVKKPGAKEWVNAATPAGGKIRTVAGPDASTPAAELYP